MTNTTLATLRHDASALLDQMPEGVLVSMIALMKEFAGSKGHGEHMALLPPGFAAGEFELPDDFDADNELIADMFEGK
ncbi:MAG: hypothetical protein IKZ87_05010 [Actinomycetaceae bacterium]|nr:hypothetical protein [Actinomycetaceae bacterium]